jgi:hypothetical protein
VSVYVVGPDDEPIPYANVTIEDAGETAASGPMDAAGCFVTQIDRSSYTIHVSASGHAPDRRRVAVDGDEVFVFELEGASQAAMHPVDVGIETRDLKTWCRIDASYSIQTAGSEIPFPETGRTGTQGTAEDTVPVKAGLDGTLDPVLYAFNVDKQGYSNPLQTTRGVDGNTLANVRLDPIESSLNLSVTADRAGQTLPAEDAIVRVEGRCPNTGAPAAPNGSSAPTTRATPCYPACRRPRTRSPSPSTATRPSPAR